MRSPRPSTGSPRSTASTSAGCSTRRPLDFDDLLTMTVRLFREHPDVLARWRARFTPRARRRVPGHQRRPVGARPHRSPRSTATCWSWATPISASSRARSSRWATARAARSSRCAVGDEVLSCYGSGDFRPARVMRVHRSAAPAGVAITTSAVVASCRRPTTSTSPVMGRTLAQRRDASHRTSCALGAAVAGSVACGRDGDGRRATGGPIRSTWVEPVQLDRAGLRPRHRADAQLRRRRPRHPQLDLQVPRGGLPEPACGSRRCSPTRR